MIKAVIFDFDGLLLDTETPSFDVWQEIFQEHGAVLERSKWVQCVGASYDHFHPCTHLESLIGRKVNHQELIDRKNKRKTEICDLLPWMPGALDKIAEAKTLGFKRAIASSSHFHWIDRYLKQRNLESEFDATSTGNEVKQTKPSPDLYLLAAKKLGVDPKDCIAFEDSRNGVTAAKTAGLRAVIAVPNSITENSDFSHADLRLRSLDEISLSDILKNF